MNKERYGITPDNLLRMLPVALTRDEDMLALGTMLAQALGNLADLPGKAMIYPNIYELDEPVLDILARDFKVDWYNYNYSVDTKRSMIHNSFFIHNHLGTRASVVKALSDVFPNSAVEEWYEYGGAPYHFRVIIDMTNAQEPAHLGSLRHAVDYYKSLRSHLEDDAFIPRVSCGIKVKTAALGSYYNVPLCGTLPDVSTQGNIGDTGLSAGMAASASLYSPRKCGTPLTAFS